MKIQRPFPGSEMAQARVARVVVAFIVVVLLAPIARAQQTVSSIAGTARDTGGMPLAGVTVEAASPVLIERVRTVVTDGQGSDQRSAAGYIRGHLQGGWVQHVHTRGSPASVGVYCPGKR